MHRNAFGDRPETLQTPMAELKRTDNSDKDMGSWNEKGRKGRQSDGKWKEGNVTADCKILHTLLLYVFSVMQSIASS